MAKPTERVRDGVYARDLWRCVACGKRGDLTFQHRRAEGSGGSADVPTFADGLTLCALCNMRCESDMQIGALMHGWKVRRWVEDASAVPVFVASARQWWMLAKDGPWAYQISGDEARARMIEVYGDEYETWVAF